MSNNNPEKAESAVLDFIEVFGKLAWRKYQQRFPQVWLNNKFQIEDHSGYPPYFSFRFESEDAMMMARLKDAVESYEGIVKWTMTEHKRKLLPGSNWSICPVRLNEVRQLAEGLGVPEGQYMAETEPGFGPQAYEDIAGLSAYLRQIFPTRTDSARSG